MPKIAKPKKKKTKKTNLPVPLKTPQSPKTTHDYYCCCAEKTKQGMPKGVKITQVARHCKQNAQKLMLAKKQTREQEKKKIVKNWQQIGQSLGKIIDNA